MSGMSRLATEVEMLFRGELSPVEQDRLLAKMDELGYDVEDFRPQLPEYVRLYRANEVAHRRAVVTLTLVFIGTALIVLALGALFITRVL